MSAVELILLQRVEKLGQMGEIVTVKPGYARNFLLPQGKAIRANAHNRERFERERVQLEAQNLKRREEAERLSERMHGLSVVLIRQAGDSGSLYGSVTTRDIAEALTQAGLTVSRSQVILPEPIKQLGVYEVRVALHPEVSMQVSVNVARSEEEAERQARGEEIGAERDDDASGFVEEAVEVEAAPEEAPVAATEEHPAA
ncbi:50S ribosomal protein L9 [Novacetimonas cocois]|uniref:Large ribosomal subunit protein bL9 n=1 Tax=Novacetimonas cocois TaxID=1747507 RepID=A0A365Z372_9PROT|nr:50S ribosomal protein L9 [Novacetimonas cocois]RBM09619.1 50S ribosomal protein L9 [Novacetimonas cocois]